MTKKLKTTLSIFGIAITTAIIIPIVTIAATSNQKTLNRSIESVNENVSNLNKLSISANANITKSAANIAQIFLSSKNDISSLSNYFNTSLLESIATANGTKATYLLEANDVSNNSTSLLFHITISSASDGIFTSKIANVTINNFPNITQAAQNVNINNLTQMNQNLSSLKLNTTTTNLSPTQVFETLSKISNVKSLELSDFNTYFNTDSITKVINNANSDTPIKIAYAINAITATNLDNGSISIAILSSTGSGTSQVSKTITLTITGFLSNNQIAINNYVNDINIATNINGKNTILPSNLSANNIAQYLNNLPVLPNGLTQTFTLSNPDNDNGNISLNITISGPNATNVTTKTIIVSGFETNNQVLVNQYIASLNQVSNISGNNTILPSVLVNTTVNLFLNNIPTPPQGINLTYTIVDSSNVSGTIDLIINASAYQANTTSSKTFLVSGFLTTKEINATALNSLIKTLKANKYIANASSNSITPQAIAKTLNLIPNLSLNDLNTYFDTNTITNDLANFLGSTISSINVNPIVASNITDGTISFNLLLNIGQGNTAISQNVTITISGFLTEIQSVAQQNNATALNSFVKQISAMTFKANTTSNSSTAQEIYTALTTQGALNLSILNKYFDTSAITNALNASTNISITSIIPMTLSSNAITSGIVSIYLRFSLGSGVENASEVNIITITGFTSSTSTTVS